MEYTHKPVLLDACIQALNIRPDGIYVDGTLGRAGHSREIAGRLTTGRLICIDRDQAAIDAAQDRLAPWLARVTLIHSNFSELKEVLSRCGVSGADGMLFDLGVSSPQLDDASRGFSYMQDAPLDMRMDTSAPLSAADIVNTWSQEELQTENVTLTAQHEQMFDLATVKEVAEAAGMSKPSSSQIYYIDLSEGDSAVVYQQEESNLLSRLLTSLNHGIYAVVEYFE